MAESIWNNNYLLSNLDAQKLYAQSPLTTGVSGTSAYIGLEPSARYNETVLWENNGSFSAKGLSAGFSEPASNFERLKFVVGTDIKNYSCLEVEYHGGSACLNWTEFYSNTFRYWTTQLDIQSNGMTAGAGYIVGWSYPNGTAFAKVGNTDWEHCYKGIKKVIGINRKEV